MRARNKKKDPIPPAVPAYIVTFSDMVTLLLTFFVMLLSLATMQDPELFDVARDSFVRHIDTFGLGMLKSKKMAPNFGNKKYKYFIKKNDTKKTNRTIDAKRQEIIENFKLLTQSMTAIPSQINAEKINYTVTDINFEKGRATLNDNAKNYLQQLTQNLKQRTQQKKITLYILALARDKTETKQQLILSANRALAVTNYIKKTMPNNWNGKIYAWGAGDGGYWLEKNSTISKKSQILIADLQGQETN